MSESKHTPGPWAYEATSGAVYAADDDVEPLIASTNLECVSIEQGDADGHLIAAAPDLLEALRWVRANYAGGSTVEINARIDAAIDKAEGRS